MQFRNHDGGDETDGQLGMYLSQDQHLVFAGWFEEQAPQSDVSHADDGLVADSAPGAGIELGVLDHDDNVDIDE